MKILIIGSGGREHAIAWKFKVEDPSAKLYIAPGNAGTAQLGENLPIAANKIEELAAWAEKNRPDITFVGPEVPLCLGVVDAFEKLGLPIFGPNAKAAQLEGSKVFTKNILQKYNLPTAKGKSFTDPNEAHAYSQTLGYPQVIKADGLAAGKGVLIAQTPWEAALAINQVMVEKAFGKAGSQVLLEEFLVGREASIHVITDGDAYRYFPVSQDHKRIGDNDTGANTGGMGAYAPAPLVDDAMRQKIDETILKPLFAAFKQEGIDFRGILYAGLMLTEQGPKVLEFNVRFGDPETQVLLPLLETPLVEVVRAVNQKRLAKLDLKFRSISAVSVVMASANYPGDPVLGDVIHGLDQISDEKGSLVVFHAGTKKNGRDIVTSGGRVLTVTAWAKDLSKARELAYHGVSKIQFAGAQFRYDIAARLSAK
jgi:phosphoribosylamine---glycine ligase